MRLVVDLDGTLCSLTAGDYSQAKPLDENISVVNKLYRQGHTIHIFTARGMGTYRGNRWLAILRWKSLTASQLKQWGVRYHKLSLGKPSGDLYIDDKAIQSNEFFSSGGSGLAARLFLP